MQNFDSVHQNIIKGDLDNLDNRDEQNPSEKELLAVKLIVCRPDYRSRHTNIQDRCNLVKRGSELEFPMQYTQHSSFY